VGPPYPGRCTAQGPGVSGGCAGTPINLTVLTFDKDRRRIRDGGQTVRAHLLTRFLCRLPYTVSLLLPYA
jgi:hypothetical protein